MNQFLYSTAGDTLYVHLYASSRMEAEVAGDKLGLEQKTNYPWDGKIAIKVSLSSPRRFALALRIPGWCEKPSLRVGGKKIALKVVRGYAMIGRTWSDGDKVELDLPMAVRPTVTNPRCRNNAGKVAIQRGPIVYCAEEVDNGPVFTCAVPRKAKWLAKYEPKLLGGVVTLSAKVVGRDVKKWGDELYRSVEQDVMKPAMLKLVPYCVWGNRKVGQMAVWLPMA